MDQIVTALLDYGPIGICLVLVVTGFLVPRTYYDREINRADKATNAAESNAEALKTLTEEVRRVRP